MKLFSKYSLRFLVTIFFIHLLSNTFASPQTETIIFIRHGEKQVDKEFGQINCKGLNRSLKLSKLLTEKYGIPNFIFAPNPNAKTGKNDSKYSYLRPLATIEPTAISLGLPVNTQFGLNDISGIKKELLSTQYSDSLIFVSWEHLALVKIVKEIFTEDTKNLSSEIPDWLSSDYDSIYKLNIVKSNYSYKITFTKESQSLDGLNETCPN
ncbi:hypothetical protein [Fluviispira vulneris]|uniref:hypothetical protein n=1 Tax=Fluviispira vulneris TaxID=2763012 RepID=UPI001647F5C1|nr:hypothetical protein [Fluviispira vulneris]